MENTNVQATDAKMGERVNRITAVFNTEDGVTMTLYRTHTKLLELSNKDIAVDSFKESGTVNKPAYMLYCKETLVNLLENGGVTGYYYDPKNNSEQSKSGIPSKFNEGTFIDWAKTTVMGILDGMDLGENIVPDICDVEMMAHVTERYKDGNIKYASVNVPVRFNSVLAKVPVDIKSGQLTKPKKIEVKDEMKGFNPTTIKALVKADEVVEEVGTKPVVVAQQPIMDTKDTTIKNDMEIVKHDILGLKTLSLEEVDKAIKSSVIPDMTDQLRDNKIDEKATINTNEPIADLVANEIINDNTNETQNDSAKVADVEKSLKEKKVKGKGKDKAPDDIKDTKASVSKMMKALKTKK